MLQVKNIISYIEELAPLSLALPGDPVGLQLGDPEMEVNRILVALDPDPGSVQEALGEGVEMLVTHHPLFFEKLASINEQEPAGALVSEAIRNRLNIYSAHTNFDITANGVSCQLARTLGFPLEQAAVIDETCREEFLKLVVFIPGGYEDKVRQALTEAGAGKMGNYSSCTFQTKGCGTFIPGDEAAPYIGHKGKLEKVEEIRMETILPASLRHDVTRALLDTHPYEEVAYDLYPLELDGIPAGLGLFLTLKEPVSIESIINRCRERLPGCSPRCQASGNKIVSRIALCGGSGGSLIQKVARLGAELYISGDFRYHELLQAGSYGLALLDAGHAPTEMPGVTYLCEYIKKCIKVGNHKAEVFMRFAVSEKWQS
jgi:dinuclear metal center YbgI/SA1388 family protein